MTGDIIRIFTDLKNRTMEDITKELNSATQYLRVMKRTGNHKEDCDNVLMHLANIDYLVNKLFIANVSKSIAKKYAEFCVECDRKGLPLLLIDDYIEQYCC
jgi:hypothetical protein